MTEDDRYCLHCYGVVIPVGEERYHCERCERTIRFTLNRIEMERDKRFCHGTFTKSSRKEGREGIDKPGSGGKEK